MVQSTDINIAANPTGLAMRTEVNSIIEAIASSHSGTSRPSYIIAGQMWLDTSGGVTAWVLKLYDGTDDIPLGTFNTSANTFTPAGTDKVLANLVSAKTATFNILSTERGVVFDCNATSGAITANGPAGVSNGFAVILFKDDSSSNAVIFDPNGSETVNGASTYSISTQNEGALLVKDASNWTAIPFSNSSRLRVSATDTTPNFLGSKLTAGNGINIVTNNPSGNENLGISVDLGTDPGLEFSADGLEVKAHTGLVKSSSGLAVDVGTTANKIVQLNGSAQLPTLDGRNLTNLPITSCQVFLSSGTFVKPQGVTYVLVEVIGGGGGARIDGTLPSSGGGGGGYLLGLVNISAVSNVTVTIGAGGILGNGANGGNGGTSSFGSYLTCTGGVGGTGASSTVAGGQPSVSGATIIESSRGHVGTATPVTDPILGSSGIYRGGLSGKHPDTYVYSFASGFSSVGQGGSASNFGSPYGTAGTQGAVIVYW